MKRILVAAFLSLSLCQFIHAQERIPLLQDDLELVRNRMTGEFSSEKQSKNDTSFFNISLKMAPIWPESKNGYWLYVEQAMASSLSKPYRQRIYHVYREDEYSIVSKVYELPNPLKYVGAADDVSRLKGLTIDSLIDRQGCAIYLHRDKNGQFTGSTKGKDCLSSLRGATYASSEVVIDQDGLTTWDRGWNANGKQVWGSVKGAYRFDRVHHD